MVISVSRSALLLAVAVALMGCETKDLLPVEPSDPVALVITTAVMAHVDDNVADADERLLPTLDDAAFRFELTTALAELNQHIAARDVARADAALARARALVERPATTIATEDFAADLGVIGVLLDQAEGLLDAAAGRTS
jgi:hypothetical protein